MPTEHLSDVVAFFLRIYKLKEKQKYLDASRCVWGLELAGPFGNWET